MERNTQFDIHYCFADDVRYENDTHPDFWKTFWEQGNGLGRIPIELIDPDSRSRKLYEYHSHLYGNRALPNGKKFIFEIGQDGYSSFQLICGNSNKCFGSDTLVNSYCNSKEVRPNCIQKIKEDEFDNDESEFKKWVEEYIRKAYTIGNMIIFPKQPSINCERWNCVRDRVDLTMECIHRHYLGNSGNPLDKNRVLQANADFFELFGAGEEGFRNYIDFFFLNPIVDDNYKVKCLLPHKEGQEFLCENDFENPLPKNKDEYKCWRKNTMKFIDARNNLINEFLQNKEN